MAFNNAQLTNFFENGPQMALTITARARIAAEGLVVKLVDLIFGNISALVWSI
jgi:hypothetical protein